MASITVCTACLRHQLRQPRQTTRFYQFRTANFKVHDTPRQLSTAHLLSAGQASPQPLAAKDPPLPKSSAISKPSEIVLPENTTPPPALNPISGLAKELRERAGSFTETYVAYGACEKLVKECARQSDYSIPQAHEKGVEVPHTKDGEDLGVGTGWWFETLNLTPTFMIWAQITMLHMYLLTCRLRMFPPQHASTWHQHLLDHFFFLAEDRMVTTHNMVARSVRNKYLKDLFVQWRGLMAGYDEGLMKGDAVLATAVWRNIFKGDENVDFRSVGEIVSYMRGVLQGLEQMSDEGIAGGEVVFGNPESERDGILVKSRLMDAPGQLAGVTAKAGGMLKAISDPSDVV